MTESESQAPQQRHLVGEVISDKMAKTIVVEVSRSERHPRYDKVMRVYKKYYAHDEKEEAQLGDTVRIAATRPLSRLKRWRLEAVLGHAKLVEKVES